MYLKKIVANGFKSFADKITIDLSNEITGIVGPNGSGKSNVVDAIRWVLGEQSVKSLRGDGNMTDVIFSGSKSRNPMNMASVTLIFDNSDKYLNLDYTEVSIQRRVYKDGTNEYSINNEKCRLKDVTDLLLDSGIAKESFNIISQGKVEEIISNKPSDRRVIFEEAAGVLKYKKRKEEALRKLDRTHANLSRVDDIIIELEVQVNPLKEQKEKALIYQEKIQELEGIEVALITNDITNINFKYQNDKEKVDKLNEEILSLTTTSTSSEAKIENYKNDISKLDESINTTQKELIEKTTLVEKANSKKTILLERKKYEVEDTKLHQNVVNLKEEQLKLESEISSLKNVIDGKNKDLDESEGEVKKLESEINTSKDKRNTMEISLANLLREKTMLDNNINALRNSIENSSSMPLGVKSVLNNPKLKGINDIIGNLFELDNKYVTAITTSLGAAISNVVVDNETCAKEAISYLKENNLGRVTFFPINVIKAKYIDTETLKTIKNESGFIDIASNLIKYDSKYKEILENQLGNVIVTDNIDSANKISKKINYRYKIVTLDGELLHIGGSITGGNLRSNRNIIKDKYDLEENIKKLDLLTDEIKNLENNINEHDYNHASIEDKYYLINKDFMSIKAEIENKEANLKELNNKLESITNEISGTNSILKNSLSSEEEAILKEYYEALEIKNKVEQSLEDLKKKRSSLNSSLEEYEFSVRKENGLFKEKSKELHNLEIEVNRMDVKLDNLLNKLSETYSMTYEKAKELYKLEIDENIARTKVNSLRKDIKELGNVNLGAIEEYDRVSERYDFLVNQKNDLMKAEDILLEIINEMDSVMEKEFAATFKIIKDNFKITFKDLFKGGDADLKLTDPSNMLETGIEIVASPPGKTLKSIQALSGGEKTFTAISLLFAILKSRPVPYCVLDEVEAALDEVNVDSFGKYLLGLKSKTQFILITHKKKTMEYADSLYGITMQESGVSKLVSVKLEELK